MAFQGDSIFWVELEKIVPNPFQPRREFDEEKLKELSESIRMYGVLQPLTVTRKEVQREDGTFYTEYELIAGERRLRASKLAGLHQVPVIIREGEDSEQEKLELAIIENLQREDLNAVDRALAFKQLSDTFGLSHTLVAKKVGRSREYVSNSIRLLALPEQMLDALKRGDMTEGHARTLLMLNDKPQEQDVIFREILLKKLSVREVERIVRKIATDKVRKKNPHEFDDDVIEMEKRFMETLGTRVQILKTDYGGRLTIDYFSAEDLEDILNRMKRDEAAKALAEAGVVTSSADTISQHTPLAVQSEDVPFVASGETANVEQDEKKLDGKKEQYNHSFPKNNLDEENTSGDVSEVEKNFTSNQVLESDVKMDDRVEYKPTQNANDVYGRVAEKKEIGSEEILNQNNQPQTYLEPKEQSDFLDEKEEVEMLESAPEYKKIEDADPDGYLPYSKNDNRDELEKVQPQTGMGNENYNAPKSPTETPGDSIQESVRNNDVSNGGPYVRNQNKSAVDSEVNPQQQPTQISKNDGFGGENIQSPPRQSESNQQKSNNENQNNQTAPVSEVTQPNRVNQVTQTNQVAKTDEDDGDLYSIRNFTV